MILGWRTSVTTYNHLLRPHKVDISNRLLQCTRQHIARLCSIRSTKNDGSRATLDSPRPGTMPERSVYLVLHTSTPSASWPAVHSKVSPLVKSLLLRLKPFHGAVNISHDPGLLMRSGTSNYLFPSAAEPAVGEEVYPATLYRSGGLPPLFIPRLSWASFDSIISFLKEDSAAPLASPGNIQPMGNVGLSL